LWSAPTRPGQHGFPDLSDARLAIHTECSPSDRNTDARTRDRLAPRRRFPHTPAGRTPWGQPAAAHRRPSSALLLDLVAGLSATGLERRRGLTPRRGSDRRRGPPGNLRLSDGVRDLRPDGCGTTALPFGTSWPIYSAHMQREARRDGSVGAHATHRMAASRCAPLGLGGGCGREER
jgi:hypothetical protein